MRAGQAPPLQRDELMRCSEFSGSVGDQRRFILQAFRDDYNTFIGLFPFLLLDGFTHIGHRFCRVAGIEARRIELMAVPFSVWQASLCDELAFALDEQPVY